MMEEEKEEERRLLQSMTDIVEEISCIPDYRNAFKKQFCNLSRRLKLLAPMFEEIRENADAIPDEILETLRPLNEALESSRDLLKFGSEGSKIRLVRSPYLPVKDSIFNPQIQFSIVDLSSSVAIRATFFLGSWHWFYPSRSLDQ